VYPSTSSAETFGGQDLIAKRIERAVLALIAHFHDKPVSSFDPVFIGDAFDVVAHDIVLVQNDLAGALFENCFAVPAQVSCLQGSYGRIDVAVLG